jgi:hypothetical protein
MSFSHLDPLLHAYAVGSSTLITRSLMRTPRQTTMPARKPMKVEAAARAKALVRSTRSSRIYN